MIAVPPATRLPDQRLMQRVQAGDITAFEVLHARHRAKVLQFALRITHNLRLAEEATQDAFLSLWRGAGRYDTERGAITTWLMAMVRNRSIDSLRREGRYDGNVPFDDAPVNWLEAAERTDDEVLARDEAARARQLMLDLPAEQRTVIELTYLVGLTHTEVARHVGIPLGTVKGRQRLGLKKLHGGLVELGFSGATAEHLSRSRAAVG